MSSIRCFFKGHKYRTIFDNRKTDGWKLDGQLSITWCYKCGKYSIDNNEYLLGY